MDLIDTMIQRGLFGLPFRQEFTAGVIVATIGLIAVRPAISAGVHSDTPACPCMDRRCSACHFGRSSQRHIWLGEFDKGLFGLPFRQEFTALSSDDTSFGIAVRPAISAGVHS